ncbi:polyprotein [Elysia marginata]|uniref:Polyprotein n=1 Tax=Elysia marginata TaxID=1093978 RepID=A0AAV4GEM3_9GAST|nr:polyprotein [Elysia marginata]
MSLPDPPLTLHSWQFPDKPCQWIHIDYAGPFLNQMFLDIVHAQTKWIDKIPTIMSTTGATIKILGSIFARFGLPGQVVSDNGPQFASEKFKAFMYTNNIRACSQCTLTSGYKRNRGAYGAKF